MQNREKLINILKTLHSTHNSECLAIYATELINSGKMPISSLQRLMTGNALDNATDSDLLWLYRPLVDKFKLESVKKFFTTEEIYRADSTVIKEYKSKLPVSFKILATLRENCYLICQNLQEIMALKQGGIIRWESNMQRESIITQVGNNFITHIAYDDNRARKIGKKMADGEFYPNTFRWHIVSSACEYTVTENEVILLDGHIAEIDGQHRDKGSEYALAENPNIDLTIPIILTIGTPSNAQFIINQDEERAPINKNVVDSYKQSSGNQVAKLITTSEDLDNVYKFCMTEQAIAAGVGFILISDLGNAIDKYFYKNQSVAKKIIQEDAKYLIDFLNELAAIPKLRNVFANAKSEYNNNWAARSSTIDYFIFIASVLSKNSLWDLNTQKIIAKIEFDKKKNPKFDLKYIKSILKEVGYNV